MPPVAAAVSGICNGNSPSPPRVACPGSSVCLAEAPLWLLPWPVSLQETPRKMSTCFLRGSLSARLMPQAGQVKARWFSAAALGWFSHQASLCLEGCSWWARGEEDWWVHSPGLCHGCSEGQSRQWPWAQHTGEAVWRTGLVWPQQWKHWDSTEPRACLGLQGPGPPGGEGWMGHMAQHPLPPCMCRSRTCRQGSSTPAFWGLWEPARHSTPLHTEGMGSGASCSVLSWSRATAFHQQ